MLAAERDVGFIVGVPSLSTSILLPQGTGLHLHYRLSHTPICRSDQLPSLNGWAALIPVRADHADVIPRTYGKHASQYHPSHSSLAQLNDEIVGLRSEDLVRTHNNRLAIIDVRLELVEPVSAGAFETFQTQLTTTRERTSSEFIGLQRSIEFPYAIRREK